MEQRIIAEKVKAYFPKAIDAKDTSIKYMGKLQNENNIDVSKVLMATSLCSDDINMPSTTFFSVLFGPFIMGGLGGLPFAGLTGVTAFAHHIPDNGTGFIFYGPHIGITMDGILGKMFRPRQDKATNSCGALMLVLDRMTNIEGYTPTIDENDYQQAKLEESLLPYKNEIIHAKNPQLKITEVTYENINKRIHEYLSKAKGEFQCEKIVLLGGIVINTKAGLDDFFDVRNFEVIDIKSLQAF